MSIYILQSLLILVLVGLSALFSASETALLSIGPAGLHQFFEEEHRYSRILAWWRDRPNQVLASLLVCNNGVNILASAVATSFAAMALKDSGVADQTAYSVAIAVGVMTFLIVLFGEVIPKTFARQHPFEMVPLMSLTWVCCILARPLSVTFEKLSINMIRASGSTVQEGVSQVTEAEVEAMIRLGSAQGTLSNDKQQYLSSIIDFTETMTKEIMVPRTDVSGFPVTATRAEVMAKIAETSYSRYPVYEGSLDKIVGILTVKDLFQVPANAAAETFSLRAMATRHPTLFVPETKLIRDLLTSLQKEHVQMAVVIDEFGGTAGIVTMEDIIEEIVGEIYDEHDADEQNVRRIGEQGVYLVQARTPLEEIEEAFAIALPDQDNYETVGGLVMAQTGRLPERGEVVVSSGLRFEVKERTRTRLLTLLVSPVPQPPDDDTTP